MPLSQIETASLSSGLVAPTATALTTASGSAPSYSARAWVNFNGTGTVAIRASGNVSSITDNGTGDYTVNFATAMPDANYSYSGSFSPNYAVVYPGGISINTVGSAESAPTTSAFRFVCIGVNSAIYDPKYMNLSIFR